MADIKQRMRKAKIGKHAHLLHNPKAGDGGYAKDELIEAITSCGYTCHYTSIKNPRWSRFNNKTTLIVIAGGDGTVRKVMKKLLERKVLDRRLAIALLPVGTANNFARALGLSDSIPELRTIIAGWKLMSVDVGAVSNLRGAKFFLEGMGFGIFPKLIKVMEQVPLSAIDTANKELDLAMEKLITIARAYVAKHAEVEIDGITYEGDYLLVEVLNLDAIGPNLPLAPQASPADGKFHVVMVKEEHRNEFLAYLQVLKTRRHVKNHIKMPWQIIEAKAEIVLRPDNRLLHVDDELIRLNRRRPIKVEMRPGILAMLVQSTVRNR